MIVLTRLAKAVTLGDNEAVVGVVTEEHEEGGESSHAIKVGSR